MTRPTHRAEEQQKEPSRGVPTDAGSMPARRSDPKPPKPRRRYKRLRCPDNRRNATRKPSKRSTPIRLKRKTTPILPCHHACMSAIRAPLSPSPISSLPIVHPHPRVKSGAAFPSGDSDQHPTKRLNSALGKPGAPRGERRPTAHRSARNHRSVRTCARQR